MEWNEIPNGQLFIGRGRGGVKAIWLKGTTSSRRERFPKFRLIHVKGLEYLGGVEGYINPEEYDPVGFEEYEPLEMEIT